MIAPRETYTACVVFCDSAERYRKGTRVPPTAPRPSHAAVWYYVQYIAVFRYSRTAVRLTTVL